jgi:hypothetical protein
MSSPALKLIYGTELRRVPVIPDTFEELLAIAGDLFKCVPSKFLLILQSYEPIEIASNEDLCTALVLAFEAQSPLTMLRMEVVGESVVDSILGNISSEESVDSADEEIKAVETVDKSELAQIEHADAAIATSAIETHEAEISAVIECREMGNGTVLIEGVDESSSAIVET